MPGKGHFLSWEERVGRTLRSGTLRTAGGAGSNASPGLVRDRLTASARGASSGLSPLARASKVDVFTVSDAATDTFTLTYVPVPGSWNLMLNGVRVHSDEWSITGKVITVTDAADLFLAASGTFPYDLEIQYDYLAGVPSSPVNVLTTDVFHESHSFGFAMSFGEDAGPESVIVIGVISGGTHTFTGRGTWTQLTTHSYQSKTMTIYIGYDFGAAGTQMTLTLSTIGGVIAHLLDKGNAHPTLPTVAMSSWTEVFGAGMATGSVSAPAASAVVAFGGGPKVTAITSRTDTGVTLGADIFENNMSGTEIVSAAGEKGSAGTCSTAWAQPPSGTGTMGIILAVTV